MGSKSLEELLPKVCPDLDGSTLVPSRVRRKIPRPVHRFHYRPYVEAALGGRIRDNLAWPTDGPASRAVGPVLEVVVVDVSSLWHLQELKLLRRSSHALTWLRCRSPAWSRGCRWQ